MFLLVGFSYMNTFCVLPTNKTEKLPTTKFCKAVFTWYWIEFRSGTTSPRFHTEYLYSFTWYWIEFHSGTTSSRFYTEYLYSFKWYRIEFHSSTTFIPVPYWVSIFGYMILDRVSFQYDFIPVLYRVSIFVCMMPTKISLRNESFQSEFIPVVAPDRTFRSRTKYVKRSTGIV